MHRSPWEAATRWPRVHDHDGNLTEDAKSNKHSEDREYVWDGENCLHSVQTVPDADSAPRIRYWESPLRADRRCLIAVNKVTARDNEGKISATDPLVSYAYDARSRRILRIDAVEETTTLYLYDGWQRGEPGGRSARCGSAMVLGIGEAEGC